MDIRELFEKAHKLNDLAMVYEVAVIPLPEADYLKEFYDFFEIGHRDSRLIPSGEDFDAAFELVCGDYGREAITGETKRLFGAPTRVTMFDDDAAFRQLRDELDGPGGLTGLFFVFDVMFCEYGDFTLCFINGSNN